MRIVPMRFMLFIGFLFLINNAYAQTKTVLINGVATKVSYTETDVTAIDKEVKNYMRGFENAPFDPFKKASPIPSPIVRTAATSTPATKPSVKKTEMTPELSDENALSFEPGSAILTYESTLAVKKAAAKITSGKAKSVLLKSWHRTGNKISKELVKERLEACKASFIDNGVVTNVILTSMTAGQEESKVVTIEIE